MSKDLVVFDSLKAEIIQFVAPVKTLLVTDAKSANDATIVRNKIGELLKRVTLARTTLTAPLKAKAKEVEDVAHMISAPLLEAERHAKSQIDAYAVKQEEIRQNELRKVDEARRAAERRAAEEARKIAQEQEEARQFELTRIREEAKAAEEMFGTTVDTSEQIREAEENAERERLETQARFEREQIERANKAKAAEYDANETQLSGVRKTWKVRVLDIKKVPEQYLIVELNEKMAIAARASNPNIPGLEFYQEISVPRGKNTYVPRAMLEGK
jgi:hypothetical protein